MPVECDEEESFLDITDFQEKDFRHLLQPYLNELVNVFERAVDKIIPYLRTELAKMNEQNGEETVQATLLYAVIRNWDNDFAAKVTPVADRNVQKIYGHFRKDQRPFKEGIGFEKVGAAMSFYEIPSPVFDLIDTRAIEWLSGIDSFWMGKFITDDDTEHRFVRWIEKKFRSGDVPVGKNSYLIDEFIKEFADEVRLERWKIRRIIETTANRTRAYANVRYLHQAQIEKFEIVEVMDQRTCPWCRHMNGQVMSIPGANDEIEASVASDLQSQSPFATSIKLDDFKAMNAAVLQTKGFSMPPFHPHCRGRVIAVF